jgi:hypothetical protein
MRECLSSAASSSVQADSASAPLLAAGARPSANLHAMDATRPPALDARPCPDELTSEARGLFAGGWYATRDEGRLVHLVDQVEQIVSARTWRALRELGAGAPSATVPQQVPA